MDNISQPVWIAIAAGLVALLLAVTMGVVSSKNHMPLEGKVSIKIK
jgi:hypothetical protein